MRIKDIVLHHLSSEDAERFGQWAFGADYMIMSCGTHFLAAWNERHAEKLPLDLSSPILEDISKMVSLWKELNDSSL